MAAACWRILLFGLVLFCLQLRPATVAGQSGGTSDYLFYYVADDGLYLRDAAGTNTRLGILPSTSRLSDNTISPDGRHLLAWGRVALTADLNGRNQIVLSEGVDMAIWSPDSQRVALLLEDADIVQTYTMDGIPEQEITLGLNGRSVIDMDWGTSGIAIATSDGLYLVDTDTAQVRVGFDGGRMGYVDWVPDGERLLFVRLSNSAESGWLAVFSNRSVNLLDVFDETIEMTPIVRSNRGILSGLGPGRARWSPDGTRFAFIGFPVETDDSFGQALFVVDTDVLEGRVVYSTDSAAGPFLRELAWSPDGASIAVTAFGFDSSAAIIDVAAETGDATEAGIASDHYSAPVWRAVPDDVIVAITEATCFAMATTGTNLRRTPTADGFVEASLATSESIQIDAQAENESATWYHSVNNLWLRADIVTLEGDCNGLPTDFAPD